MPSKSNKPNRRKTILLIHKVLGLVTGVVLFIVSITGCLWVFKDEIDNLNNDYTFVETQKKDFISTSDAKAIAEKAIPNKTIHGVVYGKPNEAIEIVFYQTDPQLFYQSLFLNPYSGKVLKIIDHNAGFFSFILKGHVRLWLPEAIGSRIVSYSILLFFILIISGLILWIPRNCKNSKQRLTFDWNSRTRWKRKNFDLHTVIGFYMSSLGLIFAFTGCIMAFNWFYFIAYKATGGNKNPRFVFPKNIAMNKTKERPTFNQLIPKLRKTYPKTNSFEFHFPESDTTSILIEANNSVGLHYDMDYLFFDQNTLQQIETTSIYGKYKNASFADKVIRMNYDIHIGAIGGIVGKIIAFIASLICASLPVSGVLLWYGRKYKK